VSSFERKGIKREGAGGAARQVEGVPKEEMVLSSYQMPSLDNPRSRNYQESKKKFGALASTDPERSKRLRRDARFEVSPLARGPLHIADEEKRELQDRVKKEVDRVRESAREEAHQKGYEEGLEKGRQEAFEKATQEASARLKEFETLIQSFEGARDEIFKENEKFIFQVIHHICQAIVLKELETDHDYILRLAQELVAKTGLKDSIRIRVSPRDRDNVGRLKESLNDAFDKLTNLSIEVSDQIELGGCQVDTQWSSLNATLERQLQGFKEALLPSDPAQGE